MDANAERNSQDDSLVASLENNRSRMNQKGENSKSKFSKKNKWNTWIVFDNTMQTFMALSEKLMVRRKINFKKEGFLRIK